MSRLWQAAADEPLVSFAVVGGLLFAINGFRSNRDSQQTIEVRPATIRALEQMQQDLLGRPLTEEERQELVAGYIDEEVLLREAYNRELEKKDSRVRKRLLAVMRSTLDQPVTAPTRVELEAYFLENRERYAVDQIITFDQVFFAYESENEPADADEFLDSLRGGADHTDFGDYTLFGSVLPERTQNQLRRTFGAPFAEQVFLLPLDVW